MTKKRDDFTKRTKDKLKDRVNGLCSSPNCRTLTTGPHTDKAERTNNGNAAHITAASEKGPRFNPNLTSEQRKHISNGIWLCVSCSNIIDADANRFSVKLLHKWKEEAEKYAQDVLDGKVKHIPAMVLNDIYTKDKNGQNFYSRNNLTDTKGKVAKYIYDHEVDFFLTKNTVIAEILNILPETLQRVLKYFNRDGLINMEKRIINKVALKSLFKELDDCIKLIG